MDADRRRVEIQDHPARSRPGLPRPLASKSTCLTDPFDLRLADREQHTPGRRHRRDAPEQRALASEHREIRDAPSTVRGHHRQITKHPARIMGRAALPGTRQSTRQSHPSAPGAAR